MGEVIATFAGCRQGNFVREMCSLPLAEDIPITFNSVRQGVRSLEWRDDKPAELCWIETQVQLSTVPLCYSLQGVQL